MWKFHQERFKVRPERHFLKGKTHSTKCKPSPLSEKQKTNKQENQKVWQFPRGWPLLKPIQLSVCLLGAGHSLCLDIPTDLVDREAPSTALCGAVSGSRRPSWREASWNLWALMQTRRDELDTLLGLGVLFFFFLFWPKYQVGGETWSPGIMHTVELSKSFFF